MMENKDQKILGSDVFSVIISYLSDDKLTDQIKLKNISDLSVDKWVKRLNSQKIFSNKKDFLMDQKNFNLSPVDNYIREITRNGKVVANSYTYDTNLSRMLLKSCQDNKPKIFKSFLTLFNVLISKIPNVIDKNRIIEIILKETSITATKYKHEEISQILYTLNNKVVNNWLMVGAAGAGNINVMKKLIQEGAWSYREALELGAANNRIREVKILKSEVKNVSTAVRMAAEKGYFDILVILDPQFFYREIILSAASYGGYRGIIQIMINAMGATDFDSALLNSSKGGHLNLVKFFLPRSSQTPELLSVVISAAASCGFLEIVQFLYFVGANNLDISLEQASKNGHISVVEFLLFPPNLRKNNVRASSENSLINASIGGHLEIIELLTQGKVNKKIANIVLRYGCRGNQLKIVKWALYNGAKNYRFISETSDTDIMIILLNIDRNEKKQVILRSDFQSAMKNSVISGNTNSVVLLKKFIPEIPTIYINPPVLYRDVEIYLLRLNLNLNIPIYPQINLN